MVVCLMIFERFMSQFSGNGLVGHGAGVSGKPGGNPDADSCGRVCQRAVGLDVDRGPEAKPAQDDRDLQNCGRRAEGDGKDQVGCHDPETMRSCWRDRHQVLLLI
jgi:hypothetical protein